MNYYKILFISIICLFFFVKVEAQIFNSITNEDIEAELQKRGIDPEELKASLLEKDIDIETIDPENLTEDQKLIIRKTILDLSQKKAIEDSVKKKDTLPEITNVIRDTIFIDAPITENRKPEVKIYGQGLFRNKALLIRNGQSQLKVPESYILGPGDELVISIWGRSHLDNSYVIGNDGYVKLLDNKYRVFVKGMTVQSARVKLEKILKDIYSFSKGEFDLSVNYTRTVRVSIYGEVYNNPGAHAFSGLNTAFNALAAVNGPSDFGSLRKIQLQKSGGKVLNMDIYKFMLNPSIQKEFYLEDNDIILVPIQENIVSISGAIRRPLKYELLENENLEHLINYAGGFLENAYKSKIQIERYENDDKIIIDLDWNDRSTQSFKLKDGDYVTVETIEALAENFIEASGEILKPARYERSENMRLSDLIEEVGLTDRTHREISFLQRKREDGTIEFKRFSISEILNNENSLENIILQNEDKIEFWSYERFADETSIFISGAIRQEGEYPYDMSRTFKLSDAINLAGGLRRDASNYVTIHKNDPLNTKKKYYKTIEDIQSIIDNPSDDSNILINPFDSIVIESLEDFGEELYVRIEGAINNPGKFVYGENMTFKDLMILAKGFKMAASKNNIEVSRVIQKDNEATNIIVAILEVDENFNVLTKGTANGEYQLQPFDNIAVRYIKDFELQKRVFLDGEIEAPGPYAIYQDNLKISTIINRAGGLSPEAYAAGATLFREEGDIGNIVIKLDEILRDPSSEFNIAVKNGDRIQIPKLIEFVTIKGATRVSDVLSDDIIAEDNAIKVPFQKGKNAMFYINEHAGGLAENADKSKIFVEHANGEIHQTKQGFVFGKRYPKVLQGSTISVGEKSQKNQEDEKSNDTDWSNVLGDAVGQAVSILTLILLIQRLD